MAFKAKVLGREELMRKFDRLIPEAKEMVAEAKLEVAKEAANLISAEAPHKTGDYMYRIRGGFQKDNPGISVFGGRKSKDPDAVGVYAPFIWRFIEFGTAPHLIKQKRPGGLLNINGRLIKSVQHPGARAQPHVFPTWKEYKPKGMKLIRKALNDAVKRSLGK